MTRAVYCVTAWPERRVTGIGFWLRRPGAAPHAHQSQIPETDHKNLQTPGNHE